MLFKKLSWYRSVVGKSMGDTDVTVLLVVQDLPADIVSCVLEDQLKSLKKFVHLTETWNMCGTRKMMKATPIRRMIIVGAQVFSSSFHFRLPKVSS